jgi:hypothetical protein
MAAGCVSVDTSRPAAPQSLSRRMLMPFPPCMPSLLGQVSPLLDAPDPPRAARGIRPRRCTSGIGSSTPAVRCWPHAAHRCPARHPRCPGMARPRPPYITFWARRCSIAGPLRSLDRPPSPHVDLRAARGLLVGAAVARLARDHRRHGWRRDER